MADELTATAKADAALRRLKRVALYVLLAAVIIAAWGIFTRVQTRAALKQDAQQSSVPIVIVTMPSHSDVADELVLPGDVQAFADAPIYARTSGYLKRWYADIGVHRITVAVRGSTIGDMRDELRRFGDEVIAKSGDL